MANRSTRNRACLSDASGSSNFEARIGLIDEFDEKCAQAIAIAGLLMEANIDAEVQDSAWAIRSLVERAAIIAAQLFSPPKRRKKDH